MNLQFIDNLYNISNKHQNQVYGAARFLTGATAAYLILFGGALSISNMMGQILKETFSQSSRVKLTLISGLIFFSALMKTLYHQHLTSFQPFDSSSYTQNTSALRLIIAGLLVGFGSQFAVKDSNSSFSLDGVPAFNVKSILGNIIVLITGCLTYTYKLHTFLPQTPRIIDLDLPENITYTAYLLVFLLIPFVCFVISSKKSFKTLISYMSLFSVGIAYGYGLMKGGFTERKTVYSFMILDQKWNPDMIFMFGYSLVLGAIVSLVMRYTMKKPVFQSQLAEDKTKLTLSLFVGAVIYGIGWGLGGLRPASVILLMPLQSIKIVFYWGLSCLIGMKASHKLFQQKNKQIPADKNQKPQ